MPSAKVVPHDHPSSHKIRHYRRRQTTQTPTPSASLSPGERNHPWPINFGSAAGCNFAYQEKLVLDDRCELDRPLTRNEGTADVEHPVGAVVQIDRRFEDLKGQAMDANAIKFGRK